MLRSRNSLVQDVAVALISYEGSGDSALWVDDELSGKTADFVFGGGVAALGRGVNGEGEGVQGGVLGKPGSERAGRVPDVDGEENDVFVFAGVLAGEGVGAGERLPARLAPGSPKIQDDGFAPVVGKMD